MTTENLVKLLQMTGAALAILAAAADDGGGEIAGFFAGSQSERLRLQP